MTLLLKMSRVGVNSVSMENDEVEGVGDDGETKEGGLSLLQIPRGRDGDCLSLSFVLAGSGRCVVDRTRVEDCGEEWGEEAERNKGLEGFCRSILGVRLLKGLLPLFMYISISSARLRRELDALLSWSHSGTVAVAISDRGSNPISIPVLLTVPALQGIAALSTGCFCLSVSVTSSSTSCSLSEAS